MKKLISLFLFVAVLTSFGITSHATSYQYILNGTTYPGTIIEISSQKQMNLGLYINDISVYNGLININGTIIGDKVKTPISLKGEVVNSQSDYLSGKSLTLLLTSETEGYEVLSCTYEPRGISSLLLPINKMLNNQAIVKLALKNTIDGSILYFEDSFANNIDFDTIVREVDEQIAQEALCQERWFEAFLNVSEEASEDSEKSALLMDKISKSLSVKGDVSLAASDPFPGVSASLFTSPGESKYTTGSSYGYYRRTYGYPVGSGNCITHLIKWTTVRNAPVVNGSDGTVSLAIDVEGTYHYNAELDLISFWEASSGYRIKYPAVQLALMSEDSDIITKVEKDVAWKGDSVSVNWKSWVGLLPYGSKLIKMYNLLSSVKFVEESTSANTSYFYDNIEDSLDAWGKVHKDYKLTIPSSKYLNTDGDQVSFSVTVKKPTDADNYYTYNSGSKMAGYAIYFKLYDTNSNQYKMTFDRKYERTY